MGQQNLRLRREEERVVKDAPVKRFLTETIAGDEQTAPFAVPQRERKHAVELADHAVAILFIEMRKHFRIGSAAEGVSTFFEFGSEFAIVVDLAVEYDRDTLVFVEDRLFTGNEVDDCEPAHTECDAVSHKQTF